jgi:hypothetical protein
MRARRSITRARSSIAAVLGAALLCAAPPTAAAQQPTVTAPPPAAHRLYAHLTQLGGELELPKATPDGAALLSSKAFSEARFVNRDGYMIRVLAFGQTVGLRISRPHSRRQLTTTTYLARGRVTPTSIRASFGDLGRVELHFRRSTRTLPLSPFDSCKARGRGPVIRFGLFVGNLSFRGEGGYTSAEVHRLHGGSIDIGALIACLRGGAVRPERMESPSPRSPFLPTPLPALLEPRGHRAPPPAEAPTHPSGRPRPTVLLVEDAQPLSRTIFAALGDGRHRVRYVAAVTSSEGRVAILRVATATARVSSFAVDGSLSKARVTPPPPFEGSGLFEHGAGSTKSWSGSLAVSFLGAGHLPLTGPPFRALLGQEF